MNTRVTSGSQGLEGGEGVSGARALGPSTSSLIGRLSLVGAKVAVVGHGDGLARALGFLHRAGSACVVMDDPYHAVAEFSFRPSTYDAAVLVLSSFYSEELAVITTIRRLSPRTRIYVAGAEQQLSMLATAVRLGATGVLTGDGLEELVARNGAEEGKPERGHSQVKEEGREVAEEASFNGDATTDEGQLDDEESEGQNGVVEPILTAEELHALLHEDPMMPEAGR